MPRPLVVQYLYVHGPGEHFDYPSSRSQADGGRLAARYLECALVQAASLRLRGVDCDLALVTNLSERRTLAGRGARLLAQIEELDVQMLFADYLHGPQAQTALFASSRYVFDAIIAAAEQVAPETQLWLMDVDCVWLDAPKVFAAAPSSPGVGCIVIPYPPDWDLFGGCTPGNMDALAVSMGAPEGSLRWVGGELLAGAAADLRALVSSCEELERELESTKRFTTEEQLLSLAGALGRVQFHDLFAVAQRVWTGPRHGAPPARDPGSLGLLHLPSEKGLGFRRAAQALSAGRPEKLTRDLEAPARALKRFNVQGAGFTRRIRDDSWLAMQRIRDRMRSGGR